MKANGQRKRAPAAPPSEVRRAPQGADVREMLRALDDAADWIEGARDKVDDLVFTAQDATLLHPLLTRKSLRRSAYEDGIEGMRLLRFALEAVNLARGKLARP